MTMTRALVFDRTGTKKSRRILKQTSILGRLRPSKSKDDKNIHNDQPILVKGLKDLHSKITSLIKLECEWVLSVEMALRIKKCMIVITSPFKEKKRKKEIMPLTSNHITIEDDDNDKFLIKEDIEEALPIFE